MKKKVIRLFLFFFALCLPFIVLSQPDCIPQKPSPAKLVNNFSKEAPDFLSSSQERELESKLEDFSNNTSNQIVVVIVDDLCDYSANEFSTMLGQKWGVGQGKFDNGVVVMIKPTGREGERDVYIAVGYGLEGAIPDITAKRIVEREIIPQFKTGNYYAGVDAATDVLISLVQKEYSYKDYNKKGRGSPSGFFIALIIILVIFSFVFRNSRRYTISRRGRTFYGGGFGSWGGGGWGRGGGGGFGGFGGGGFGGGGAGGKW